MKRTTSALALAVATVAVVRCGGSTGQPSEAPSGSPADGGADATVEGGLDAGADASNDSDLYTDTFDVEIPYADRELPEAQAPKEAGPGGGPAPCGGTCLLPCTSPAMTGCVPCDGNTGGVCTGTEAIIVQRDIEKGAYTLDAGADAGPGPHLSSQSCYECLVTNTCIDATTGLHSASGNECEDLGTHPVLTGNSYTLSQACLDTLNCVLGYPQVGDAGTGGAPAVPQPACSYNPLQDGGDGTLSCFCGSAEPRASGCMSAQPISPGTSGQGPGVDSPNGICASVILAALGLLPTTANNVIVSDLNNQSNGAGQAFGIANCGGATSDPIICPGCFQ